MTIICNRELIEKGYVYIAQPPLYKISKGRGDEEYAYNDDDKLRILSRIIGIDEADISSSKAIIDQAVTGGKISIQRFKGLGMSF